MTAPTLTTKLDRESPEAKALFAHNHALAQQLRALDDTVDDLTKIKGVGPRICRVLHAAGLHTFADLSQSTPEQLTDILLAVDTSFRARSQII